MLAGTAITRLPATPELPGRMFCDISIHWLPGLTKPPSIMSPRARCSGRPLQRTFQEPQLLIHRQSLGTIALSQDVPLQGMAVSGQGEKPLQGPWQAPRHRGRRARHDEWGGSACSPVSAPTGWLTAVKPSLDLIYAN